ncbi:hypothetical protein NECID01_1257 [Nematocida sp. AWRm77]|nr:hypothetical protein NECID01_1257 [Nematocida sp. AWRm77]
MSPAEKEHAVKKLVKELGCPENQARNALVLARGDSETAAAIVKEYNSAKKTNYVGGQSGQIVEVPKSEYADAFEKLMKHSKQNEGEPATCKKTLTIYKNGLLIDDKFVRLSEKEKKAMIDKISETGEVPSELFGIKRGDLIDVEIVTDQTEELYKEDYPGRSYTIGRSPSLPKETGDVIDLGSTEVVLKLTLNGTNVMVNLGGCASFAPLREYLENQNIEGTLVCGGKDVPWEECPEKYNRSLIRLK